MFPVIASGFWSSHPVRCFCYSLKLDGSMIDKSVTIAMWQVLFFKFELFSNYFRITTRIYRFATTPLRYSCEWVSGSAASNKTKVTTK